VKIQWNCGHQPLQVGASDVRTEHDLPVVLAHDTVGKPVEPGCSGTGRVDHPAVVPGPMLNLGRLLCRAHRQNNALKIKLVVHTPSTLATDTEMSVSEMANQPEFNLAGARLRALLHLAARETV
jgi:hypothetical protein